MAVLFFNCYLYKLNKNKIEINIYTNKSLATGDGISNVEGKDDEEEDDEEEDDEEEDDEEEDDEEEEEEEEEEANFKNLIDIGRREVNLLEKLEEDDEEIDSYLEEEVNNIVLNKNTLKKNNSFIKGWFGK